MAADPPPNHPGPIPVHDTAAVHDTAIHDTLERVGEQFCARQFAALFAAQPMSLMFRDDRFDPGKFLDMMPQRRANSLPNILWWHRRHVWG